MDIELLRDKYKNLLSSEQDYQKVGWGSCDSQEKRFQVLSQISSDLLTSTILDYGCGLGAFYGYLDQQNFMGTYRGYDLLDEMLCIARNRYPKIDFLNNFTRYKPDYTIASGIFTFSNFQSMCQEIERMFLISQKGIAFNSLSILASSKEEGEFYASPTQVLEFCFSLTGKLCLKHDYLPHDFTVYMYK